MMEAPVTRTVVLSFVTDMFSCHRTIKLLCASKRKWISNMVDLIDTNYVKL